MKLNSIIIIVIVLIGIYLIIKNINEPFDTTPKDNDVTLLPQPGGDGSKTNPWTYHVTDDKGVISINEKKPSDVNIKSWIGKNIKPFIPKESKNNNFKIVFPENHSVHITRKIRDNQTTMDTIEGVYDSKLKSINGIQIENLISFKIF